MNLKKKWLITGGCGFIGSRLSEILITTTKDEVVLFDNLSVGKLDNFVGLIERYKSSDALDVCNRLSMVEDDITNRDAIISAAQGSNIIVHLAANTGVAPSVKNPVLDATQNIFGTLNVLEAARAQQNTHVIFASSGAPLGAQQPPLNENLAPKPASPYGASKLAGEGYCSAYYYSFDVPSTVLRFGNVYGPGSQLKDSVVAKFIRLAMTKQPIEVYGDGEQTRDYIFIDDLVGAIIASSELRRPGSGVYQIATHKETTISELIDILQRSFEKLNLEFPRVKYGPKRQGDVMRNYSDTTKAKRELGWSASTPLEDGIMKTINFFQNLMEQEQ